MDNLSNSIFFIQIQYIMSKQIKFTGEEYNRASESNNRVNNPATQASQPSACNCHGQAAPRLDDCEPMSETELSAKVDQCIKDTFCAMFEQYDVNREMAFAVLDDLLFEDTSKFIESLAEVGYLVAQSNAEDKPRIIGGLSKAAFVVNTVTNNWQQLCNLRNMLGRINELCDK